VFSIGLCTVPNSPFVLRTMPPRRFRRLVSRGTARLLIWSLSREARVYACSVGPREDRSALSVPTAPTMAVSPNPPGIVWGAKAKPPVFSMDCPRRLCCVARVLRGSSFSPQSFAAIRSRSGHEHCALTVVSVLVSSSGSGKRGRFFAQLARTGSRLPSCC